MLNNVQDSEIKTKSQVLFFSCHLFLYLLYPIAMKENLKMRFVCFAFFTVICLSVSSVFGLDFEKCEVELLQLEENSDVVDNTSLYDACGFTNEQTVWNKWAPLASRKNARKMLYEICYRYPNHTYHQMYCDKAFHSGYGPAVAYKAIKLLKQYNGDLGLRVATVAAKSGELNLEQSGSLSEAIAVYYLKQNNERFKDYLQLAVVQRSALANHISGVLLYLSSDGTLENSKQAFEHIWRAILLGCTSAQENLGLFHLVLQKKIDIKQAKDMMKQQMFSCDGTVFEEQEKFDEALYTCQCKSVLTTEQRFRDKPFLMKSSAGERAVLIDQNGIEYNVGAADNLPNQGVVAEVHKTGVVLTYPDERVVLNLYQENQCVSFCKKYQINENLTPEQMKEKLSGQTARIKPYRITFTDKECQDIAYYAPHYVDVNLPYFGKKECQSDGLNINQEDLLLKSLQSNGITDIGIKEETVQNQKSEELSDENRRQLYQLGNDLINSK